MSKPKASKGLLQTKQALFLPVGSVRAIIALMIVAPITLLAIRSGIVLSGDQYVGLVSLVLTAYFVSSAKKK